MDSGKKAVFLDRDGVVNLDHGYVGKYENVDYVPGIFTLIRQFEQAGYLPIIVTNQSGIARGLFTEVDFKQLMARIQEDFTQQGIGPIAVYYCPHHPSHGEGKYKRMCDCRKPLPGMLKQAQDELSISLRDSVLIGDSWRDIQAGQAVELKHCYFVSTMPPPEYAQLSHVSQVASLSEIDIGSLDVVVRR